jgi:hypothetical protein
MSATIVTLADRRPKSYAQRLAFEYGIPELTGLVEKILALSPAELDILSANMEAERALRGAIQRRKKQPKSKLRRIK